MKITSPEDFWSGVMFISFGVLAIFIAQRLSAGQCDAHGAGLFPDRYRSGL